MIFFAGVLFGVLIGVLVVRRVKGKSPGDEAALTVQPIKIEHHDLGPLQALLDDSEITEIMVNSPQEIFVESRGRLVKSDKTFSDANQQRKTFQSLCAVHGIHASAGTGSVYGRLKDGSAVTGLRGEAGEAFIIRKFRKTQISFEKYQEWGCLDQRILDLLRISVENGIRVLVSGSVGSGKTTFMNALMSFIPVHERVIYLENENPPSVERDHLVVVRSSLPGSRQDTTVLVEDIVRLRPDRIVVGDISDAALALVKALNAGHDGLASIYANSPVDALRRLTALCQEEAPSMPSEALRERVNTAFQLIVQLDRLSDGSRKVTSVSEVRSKDSVAEIDPIIQFKETGFDKNRKVLGEFRATGITPSYYEKLAARGVFTSPELEDAIRKMKP